MGQTKLQRMGVIKSFPINREIIYEGNKDLCLVYSLWSHREYVDSCFYSILSQLTFTDIQKYNILVYVHDYIYDYAKAVLGKVVPVANIIKLDGPECAKQRVCCQEKLKEYKVIAMSDSDNYLQSKGSVNMYSNIVIAHENPKVTFLYKGNNAEKTLVSRFNLSNFDNVEEMKDFFPELLSKIRKNDTWYFSGFISYNSSLIDKFKIEVDRCSTKNIFCDETVWLSFLAKEETIVEDYDSMEGYKFLEPSNLRVAKTKQEGVMYLMHPFLGYYRNRLQIDILQYIKNKFNNG